MLSRTIGRISQASAGFVGFASCLALLTGAPLAQPAAPSFGDLLTQAHDQAAAGHKWAPAGDNALETMSRMIDILPTATPEQIAAFEVMLAQIKADAAAPTSAIDSASEQQASSEQQVRAAPMQARAAPVTTETIETPAPPSVSEPQRVQLASTEVSAAPDPTPRAAAPVQMASRLMPPAPPATTPQVLAPAVSAPARPAVPAQATLAPYAKAMFEKGKAAEAQGDISGARRYYQIAAQGGLGPAAMALGRLYDPKILHGKTVGGIDPDPAQAQQWYDMAARLSTPNDPSSRESVTVK